MSSQEQFLEVIDRDEAERRFHAELRLFPVGEEFVDLPAALGRVLARDVVSPIDVPSFDRSNVDGYAVQAADTYGASEESPRVLRRMGAAIATGRSPDGSLVAGWAIPIATGGMLPRGADAVVMVEYVDTRESEGATLLVRRAVTPSGNVTFAGTDITLGETVVRSGELLTSRETGVLAAMGVDRVAVWRVPRVAIVSTGDELIAPGAAMRPGLVHDSNARILADAVREAGGCPVELGIVRDDYDELQRMLRRALDQCDIVLFSGGTSKGEGDLSYRVVRGLTDPGIVAHGVALKPGKPICLAVTSGKPVVILPGFPTSAIFTFHEFVAPVIRRLAGRAPSDRQTVTARLAMRVNSEVGRVEYLLVGLVHRMPDSAESPLAAGSRSAVRYTAFPMGKGSGSVTAFSRADGIVTIGRHVEIVPAGTEVEVQLLARDLQIADLVVMGSQCVGLDMLLSCLQREGFRVKYLAVGSTAGLESVRRSECDLASIHLLDPKSGEYNRPFITPPLQLIPGYLRTQGVVFRPQDPRFTGRRIEELISLVGSDAQCLMVNRNQGSGTRILIDQLLQGAKPSGYAVQTRSHNAVAAAIKQGRADWGVAIESVARQSGLGFLPLGEEKFDFVVVESRKSRPAVQAFLALVARPDIRQRLQQLGFRFEQSRP